MDMIHQSRFSENLLPLFVSLLIFIGMPLCSRLGYAVTASVWPNAKTVWTLLASGIICMALGLDLAIGAELLDSDKALRPLVTLWKNGGALSVFEIGLLISLTAVSWLAVLRDLYPFDPTGPVRTTRRDLAATSLLVAITVGYATAVIASRLYSFLGALERSIVVSLLAFLTALAILSRALRRHRPSS